MNILAIPMQENDADAKTVGEYLSALLTALWDQGEGFSGKRPFGNSGWDYEIYQALVTGGAIDGSLDDDGYLEDFDEESANRLIFQAIRKMGVSS